MVGSVAWVGERRPCWFGKAGCRETAFPIQHTLADLPTFGISEVSTASVWLEVCCSE